MKLIDAHQHLWDLNRFPYAWCQGVPKLNRSFSFLDYEAAARGTGIVKTVFVECDVDEPHLLDEARRTQSLADRHPLIAGIVAGGRPEYADFPQHLEQLARLVKVRGVRRVLHTMPDEVSQAGLFAENVRRLADRNWTFDLCVLARQLPLAMDLARKCPKVQFILDHCGVTDVKGRAFDPWRAHVREIAALPNVACKVSGLVAYADPEKWTVDDLRPWFEHVLECFGWDRLVWGGDWPVCTLGATLQRWVAAAQELACGATEAQQAKLFWRNAARIYRLEVSI